MSVDRKTQGLMVDKKWLRASGRRQRQTMPEYSRQHAAIALANQLQGLPEFRMAGIVGIYMASDGEIDLGPSMKWCWKNQIQTCVPIVQSQTKILRFSPIGKDTPLFNNRLGILEPKVKEGETLGIDRLQLLLLPLVAFDDDGNRLGMGGGFYDTTLKANQEAGGRQPLRIGVAHELQRVEKIVPDPWDMPIDMVVTDRCIRQFPKT